MKQLNQGQIYDLIINANICHYYSISQLDSLFENNIADGCNGLTNYKRIINRNIPYVDCMWMAVRPELMENEQLLFIFKWIWSNVAKPIWNKYSVDETPDNMMLITESFYKKEITQNDYMLLWHKYNVDFLQSLDTLNVSSACLDVARMAGVNYLAKSCYVYQAILHAVSGYANDLYPDKLTDAENLNKAKDIIFQRIIDECILTYEN